jgi:hypothetical protein
MIKYIGCVSPICPNSLPTILTRITRDCLCDYILNLLQLLKSLVRQRQLEKLGNVCNTKHLTEIFLSRAKEDNLGKDSCELFSLHLSAQNMAVSPDPIETANFSIVFDQFHYVSHHKEPQSFAE